MFIRWHARGVSVELLAPSEPEPRSHSRRRSRGSPRSRSRPRAARAAGAGAERAAAAGLVVRRARGVDLELLPPLEPELCSRTHRRCRGCAAAAGSRRLSCSCNPETHQPRPRACDLQDCIIFLEVSATTRFGVQVLK